jgi:hypothetical protein
MARPPLECQRRELRQVTRTHRFTPASNHLDQAGGIPQYVAQLVLAAGEVHLVVDALTPTLG